MVWYDIHIPVDWAQNSFCDAGRLSHVKSHGSQHECLHIEEEHPAHDEEKEGTDDVSNWTIEVGSKILTCDYECFFHGCIPLLLLRELKENIFETHFFWTKFQDTHA
jgi:hypothetical protein